MAQLPPEETPEIPRDLLQQNVQKTVAISTLRKIRRIVDEYEDADRSNVRLSRRVVSAGAVITGCLVLAIVVTGAALPRYVTAVLAWFRG